ncbi:MAG: ABC transporter permease [Clostridia bacterium]|nr:ABC transporter permease [Clostridia bacterium]
MEILSTLPGAVALGVIWGIMAIGVYITYRILDVADLTVDGSFATGAAVCAVLLIGGENVYVALLAAVAAGMLAGLVTGLLHTFFGIPAILSGILTQLMLWTVNLKVMGGANKTVSARRLPVLITSMRNTEAITTLLVAAFILIVVLYWFFGTERGCSIRATGCNLMMSRAQGINTSFNQVLGLMISNGIVALSGALFCQYQGTADINNGRGAIVIGLAAVIIGEALMSKIARNFAVRLLSVIIGGIVYYVLYQVIIELGLDTDYLKMLTALLVAVFLGLPHIRKNYLPTRHKKEGKQHA